MDTDTDVGAVSPRVPGSRRRPRYVALVAAALALLLAGTVAAVRLDVLGAGSLQLPWVAADGADDDCATEPTTTVEVVVSPDVSRIVQDLLAGANGTKLAGAGCLQVAVRSQAPGATARDTESVPLERAPQLWIPDSSAWLGRVTRWPLERVAGLGTSPVVLATSQAAVERRGWAAAPPTWTAALGGSLPVAVPRLEDNGAGVTALLGLWQALGGGVRAERAVAAAVLVSSRTRAPTQEAAIRAGIRNDPTAPLLLTSELTVFSTNRGRSRPALVAVYPKGSAPILDYPVLRVGPAQSGKAAAVQAVLSALTSESARAAVRRQGLRDPADPAAAGGGGRTGPGAAPALPPAAVLRRFLQRVDTLQTPSRLLTVVDVSLSMREPVPGTPLTRIELAAQAAARAGTLLPDDASVGLWTFAARRPGQRPFREAVPLARLSSRVAEGTHRDAVNRGLAGLPSRLSPGGTALYGTALSAVRHLRARYDPRAFNTVVLFTDGRNEKDRTLTLAGLVARLRGEAAREPDKPVQVVAIGLGPGADLAALRAIAAATEGTAYRADTPKQLEGVLFDALARRSR